MYLGLHIILSVLLYSIILHPKIGSAQNTSLQTDHWTRTPTGCPCHFNKTRMDCACCQNSGCQCPASHPHQCTFCGQATKLCGMSLELDHWTARRAGCQCFFDMKKLHCACCKNGGCQCGNDHAYQCVPCGFGCLCGQASIKLSNDLFKEQCDAMAPKLTANTTFAADTEEILCSSGSSPLLIIISIIEGIIIIIFLFIIITLIRNRSSKRTEKNIKDSSGKQKSEINKHLTQSSTSSQRSNLTESYKGPGRYQALERIGRSEPSLYEELTQLGQGQGQTAEKPQGRLGQRPFIPTISLEDSGSIHRGSEIRGSYNSPSTYEELKIENSN